jgi:hypothetical protein
MEWKWKRNEFSCLSSTRVIIKGKIKYRDAILKIEVFQSRIYFYTGQSPVGTKRNILKF